MISPERFADITVYFFVFLAIMYIRHLFKNAKEKKLEESILKHKGKADFWDSQANWEYWESQGYISKKVEGGKCHFFKKEKEKHDA